MQKRPLLKTLHNRCISCAYVCARMGQLGTNPRIVEVQDIERRKLIDKELPTQEYQPEYICYKNWLIKDVVNSVCPSKEWEAHRDGFHPETLERRKKIHKEKMEIMRWAIDTILTAATLGLIIYFVFFQN